MSKRIVIVGGGLSGLYAAYRLAQLGVTDHVLLEARPRFGGRILSASGEQTEIAHHAPDRVDLGPAWYWPAHQRQLARLVQDLDLASLAQYDEGDMMFEQAGGSPARMRGYQSAPPSVRLQGGMAALTDALRHRLDPRRLHAGAHVQEIRFLDGEVEVVAQQGKAVTHHRADRVLLAVPPRLAAATIGFSPSLPDDTHRSWSATATWMAPHAKYVAVYEAPFWRRDGLSGAAQSRRGPMVEIHDATGASGKAALFGFIGVSAANRRSMGDDMLRDACRTQLARLFGPQAAEPIDEFVKDWAADPFTATAADQVPLSHHQAAPSRTVPHGAWQDRLIGIASEWSAEFPGYLAGAVDAAERGVQRALAPSNEDAMP